METTEFKPSSTFGGLMLLAISISAFMLILSFLASLNDNQAIWVLIGLGFIIFSVALSIYFKKYFKVLKIGIDENIITLFYRSHTSKFIPVKNVSKITYYRQTLFSLIADYLITVHALQITYQDNTQELVSLYGWNLFDVGKIIFYIQKKFPSITIEGFYKTDYQIL